MTTRLGTAYVDIRPDFTKFWAEVAAQMGGFDGKSIGNTIGTSVGKSAGKAVDASLGTELKRASKQLSTIAESAGQDIADGLVRGLKDAKSEINAFARDGSASFNALRRVGADVTGSLQAPIKKVNLFARDGAASFTALGRAAQGAGTDITGSFDPASKALQRVDADLTGAIEHVGQALRGVSTDATGGFDTATRKVNLFGKDGQASFQAVGESSRRANGELKALYAGITKSNISRALGDVGKAGTRAGGDVERGFKRATDAVRNLGRDANRGGGGKGIANALGAIGGELPGGVAAIGGLRIALVLVVPALFAFGGAAGAAASALVPLIGLAASAGSVLAAAAQGFGVFKLATSGIGAALKEQTSNQLKSGAAAVNAASQQRSSARAISNAQDSVRQALEGVTKAEDNLKDAQREARTTQKALTGVRTAARRALTDMHAALTDAVLGEKGAALALKDAQQALADLQTTATQQEVARAVQDVTEAFHGQQSAALSLLRAQQSLEDLMHKAAGDEAARAGAAAALARAQANLAAVTADQNSTYAERSDALKLVADAQKAVNDANAAASVSELDKAEALQAITNAQDGVVDAQNHAIDTQKALSDLQNGPSDAEKKHALLDVAQAVQGLVEAQRDAARQAKDLAAADKLGVEGSKDVVDARDAIVEANKRVDDAEDSLQEAHRQVAKATQALSDAQLDANEALIKSAAAAQDANKAFNALPPAAQAFVRALVEMKPKLDDLRQTAAKGFFPGATEGLRSAMGSFNEIKSVIAETSTVLGEFTRKSGELVGSPAFGKDLKTIGHDNAVTIDTLGEALRHVISAIRYVLLAAAPLTKWLADTINDWAQYAASSAKAGQESGKLAKFFEKTRAIASRLGDIIGHLVHGLWGFAGAGGKVGNDIWKSIDRVATRFDEWANSVKGKKEIHEFFQKASDLAGQLVKAFGDIVKGVAWLTLEFLPLTDALKVIGPYAGELAAAFIAAKLAMFGAATAANVLAAAMWLLETPVALIALALAALAFGFYYAYTHSETFRDIVNGVLKAVGDKFTWMWNAAKDVFNWLKDHWQLLLGILTGPIGAAVYLIAKHWGTIRGAAELAWGGIRAAANLAWDGIKLVIVNPIKAIVNIIGDIWDRVGTAAGKAWKFISDEAGKFASGLANAVTDGVKGGANLVIDFINQIIHAINHLPFIPGTIGDVANIGGGDKKPNQPGKPGSNTQGVANRFRGGLVDQPMVMVGEEAPQHNEYVIPTNPAYRGRAIALTTSLMRELGMQGMPGYKTGGILGGALEGMWDLLKDGAGSILKLLPNTDKLADWTKGTGEHILHSVGGWIKDKMDGLFGGGGGGGVGGMMKKAVDIAAKGYDYSYGGGHNGAFAPSADIRGNGQFGYDCSGYVSAIMHGGKLINSPMSTDPLKVYGESGDGDIVTIGVRGSSGLNAHTMMKLAGKFFESGSGHGAKEVSGWSGDFPIHRHPKGLAEGGILQEALAQALDPRTVGWGLARGGVFPYRGAFSAGGIIGGPAGAPATITAHGGEALVPDGSGLVNALREHSAELRALRQSGVSGVMTSISDHVLQRGGDESARRRMTAGSPSVTALIS